MYPWGHAPATQQTTAYAVGNPCRNGHGSKRDIRGYCIECRRISIGKYKKRNRGKINAAERTRYAMDPTLGKERDRKRYEKDFIKVALRSAKKRASADGYPYNIEMSDIEVPEFCPVFGVKLVVGKGKFSDASPSLDKIIPELGYVRGNVWVISYKANRIKNNATLAELRALVLAIEKHQT